MVAENLSSQNGRPGLHCPQTTLVSLLDETLSAKQHAVAEQHLSQCDTCQRRLENLVGDPAVWTETRSIYAADQELGDRSDQRLDQGDELADSDDQATIAWLRSITHPSDSETHSPLGQIDRYEIQSVIGSGGMGVVVAANDPTLMRPVAIKFLAPHLAGVAPARRRFAREARAAAAVVHPSIMPIYGVNEKSYPPYLVMPLVGSSTAGRSLQDRLDAEGALELEQAIGIAAQIAEGLAAAHDRGVIHRDIKPGNVLIEENSPRVLISDFGLARAIDDATVTISGMVTGTPQYMSPEQASGDSAGPQSDLFSLGSVLYAMLTGRAPFVAQSPIAVLRKVIDTPIKAASTRNESLPPWVDRLLDAFLQKDPQTRVQSASVAAKLLRDVESHLRNPSASDLPARLRHPKRPLWATPWIVGAASLLLVIGTFPLWFELFATDAETASDATAGEMIRQEFESSIQADVSWQWQDFEREIELMRSEMDLLETLQSQPVP